MAWEGFNSTPNRSDNSDDGHTEVRLGSKPSCLFEVLLYDTLGDDCKCEPTKMQAGMEKDGSQPRVGEEGLSGDQRLDGSSDLIARMLPVDQRGRDE